VATSSTISVVTTELSVAAARSSDRRAIVSHSAMTPRLAKQETIRVLVDVVKAVARIHQIGRAHV
jgi:hypothetical protein